MIRYLSFGALLLITSCSLTRPKALESADPITLSKIYFYSPNEVQTSSRSIDGVMQGFFDSGFEVEAGKHAARLEFEAISDPCAYRTSYGCVASVIEGSCIAQFSSEAGKSYAIRLTVAGDYANVRVEEESGGAIAGSGECAIRWSRYTGRSEI